MTLIGPQLAGRFLGAGLVVASPASVAADGIETFREAINPSTPATALTATKQATGPVEYLGNTSLNNTPVEDGQQYTLLRDHPTNATFVVDVPNRDLYRIRDNHVVSRQNTTDYQDARTQALLICPNIINRNTVTSISNNSRGEPEQSIVFFNCVMP